MASMKAPESKIRGKYICNLDEVNCVVEFDGRGNLILSRNGKFAVEATYKVI